MTPFNLDTFLRAMPLAAWAILAAVIGAMLGSLLTVVIHRWPRQMMHRWQRECEAFLAERASAQSGTSSQSATTWRLTTGGSIPLVQVLSALLLASLTVVHGVQLSTLAYAVLLAGLLVLCFIDAEHMLLPDELTLGLMWLGLLLAGTGVLPLRLSDAVWGAALGYSLLAACAWLFARVTGREGMGHGDFKLLAALGAWFGAWSLLPLVLLSSVTSVVWTLLVRLWHARSAARTDTNPAGDKAAADAHFAFGPFLCLAGATLVFWPLTSTSAWGSLLLLNV